MVGGSCSLNLKGFEPKNASALKLIFDPEFSPNHSSNLRVFC